MEGIITLITLSILIGTLDLTILAVCAIVGLCKK